MASPSVGNIVTDSSQWTHWPKRLLFKYVSHFCFITQIFLNNKPMKFIIQNFFENSINYQIWGAPPQWLTVNSKLLFCIKIEEYFWQKCLFYMKGNWNPLKCQWKQKLWSYKQIAVYLYTLRCGKLLIYVISLNCADSFPFTFTLALWVTLGKAGISNQIICSSRRAWQPPNALGIPEWVEFQRRRLRPAFSSHPPLLFFSFYISLPRTKHTGPGSQTFKDVEITQHKHPKISGRGCWNL